MPTEIKTWEVSEGNKIIPIESTKLDLEERIEAWIDQDPSILGQDILIIGRQVDTDYGVTMDLLGVDSFGNTVIIELKKDKTPRDVVSQAMDYASWINDLEESRVREIAETYFSQKGLDFGESFNSKFQKDLNDIELNNNHRILIVGSQIDSSTERIVHYLSDKFKMDINAATFNYFESNKREFLIRTFLVPEDERKRKIRPKEITDLFFYLKSKFEEKHREFTSSIPPNGNWITFKGLNRPGNIHYEIKVDGTIAVDFHFEKSNEKEAFRNKIKDFVQKIEASMPGLRYGERWPRFTFKTNYSRDDDLYEEELRRNLLETLDKLITAVEPTRKQLGY